MLATLIWLGLLPALSTAQLSRVYTWGFQDDTNSNVLSQCQTITIGQNTQDTSNSSVNITPPFYGFNIPRNGTPTIQNFGAQPTAGYQIRYPAGSEIVLAFVDAFSNFGGFSSVYTIQPSGDSSCLVNQRATLTVQLNTTEVSSCAVVGAQVSGGTPPYTLTTVPFDSTTVAYNVTLPSEDNYFSFVNTIQPGSRFAFAVRDSAGNWAPTSDQIITTGQAASSCPFSSSSSNGPPSNGNQHSVSSGLPSGTSTPSTGGGSKSNTGAIVGGVVGGIAALIILALLAWFLLRRRRKAKMNAYRAPGTDATYHGPPSPALNATAATGAPVTPFALASTAAGSDARPSLSDDNESYRPFAANGSGHQQNMSQSGLSGFHVSNPDGDFAPPVAGFMANSNRNSSHGSLNSLGQGRSSLPAVPGSGASDASGVPLHEMGAGPKGVMPGSQAGPSQPVVQHQDAGPVPAELESEIPPAYANYSALRTQNQ